MLRKFYFAENLGQTNNVRLTLKTGKRHFVCVHAFINLVAGRIGHCIATQDEQRDLKIEREEEGGDGASSLTCS